MTQNQIKAIIFDVGGVLALGKDLGQLKNHKTKGIHDFISKHLGVSQDQWFDTVGGLYEGFIEGHVKETRFFKEISQIFSISSKQLKQLFIEAYVLNFNPNKGLHNFAIKLKKRGYKIAILSDQHTLSKQVVMPKSLYKKFNPVIISCDVGIRKPNPEIYKLILKKLKLPAKNCLFIDNQTWNLTPAKKLGIHTILFKDNKQLFKQLLKRGVRI